MTISRRSHEPRITRGDECGWRGKTKSGWAEVLEIAPMHGHSTQLRAVINWAWRVRALGHDVVIAGRFRGSTSAALHGEAGRSRQAMPARMLSLMYR
jgi:hypothetical protein